MGEQLLRRVFGGMKEEVVVIVVVVMIDIIVVIVVIVTVVVFVDFARLSGGKTGTREGGNGCPGISSDSRD